MKKKVSYPLDCGITLGNCFSLNKICEKSMKILELSLGGNFKSESTFFDYYK